MAITIENGARVLYRWERGVALTVTKPCDILRLYREDDRVGVELTPTWSGSTGSVTIPDRMLTESGYLHAARVEKADGEERIIETARFLVRDAQKPGNHAASTKEVRDWETLKLQMEALERAAREGEFDGADGITPHVGENGNWWLGDDDTGIAATGDDGITPHIGGNGNWYIGDVDTGVKATGDNGITPHVGENGNWFLGEIDTGVNAKGDDGITPHIGENGNWYIGEEDTGVFARNEDVSLYADDMYTSGILEKGAMQLKILEPSGSNVIRYEIESAVVYIKGVRRARGGFTTSTQAVSFERLMANILRLNVEKGTFSWRVAEVTRDGDNLVNIDNGEIYPARSGGYYDLIPYLVRVPAGATSITYDMVEDLRADERYCGYVRDRLAPEKVSELENDAGYVTDDQIENVITTDPQELTDAEKAQARANIGAAAVGEGGSGGGTVAGAPKNVWFGTCDTAADVMDKVVTTTTGDFRLEEGNILYVYFKNALQITTAFLNVDGTGSVSSNAFNGSYNAGDVVVFAYSNGMFYRTNRTEATTTFKGVVKLSSSTSSSSETMAATPKAVREVYMLARSAEEQALDAQDAAGAAKKQIVTTEGTSSAYTATVPGITALTAGVSFIMLPHASPMGSSVTLDVNGLGAKGLKRATSSGSYVDGSGQGWLSVGKPLDVMYNGTYWVIQNMAQPVATDLSGTLAIGKGGTGKTSYADTSYTSVRYRGTALYSTDTDPTTNGVINWTYK